MRRYAVRFSHPKTISSPPDKICTEKVVADLKGDSEKGYFKGLDRQELAGNSDHYPFAQRNVPCIFFMNEGGDAFKYYHTIYDTWSNSIFSSYEPTFKLLIDFVDQYK